MPKCFLHYDAMGDQENQTHQTVEFVNGEQFLRACVRSTAVQLTKRPCIVSGTQHVGF